MLGVPFYKWRDSMIKNPERATRGGDVEGSTKTDVANGLGPAADVASASYDPGYDIENSLPDTTMADVIHGFCTYGVSVGEKRGKGYL
jgi:hypothetical protein